MAGKSLTRPGSYSMVVIAAVEPTTKTVATPLESPEAADRLPDVARHVEHLVLASALDLEAPRHHFDCHDARWRCEPVDILVAFLEDFESFAVVSAREPAVLVSRINYAANPR